MPNEPSAPAQDSAPAPAHPGGAHGVPFREALRVWTLIGLQSFGGPAGQIAVMHRVLVEDRRWIGERRFLHALNYCMLLPGPEAMQLATYVGWLMHRTLGGIAAGVLFILPGFVSILALSLLYAGYRDATLVAGLFFGLKPAVLAVVVQAVIKIGRRALKNGVMYAIAAAAFIAIFFFNVPFPIIILAAGALGLIGRLVRPDLFQTLTGRAGAEDAPDDSLLGAALPEHTRPSVPRSIRVLAVWGALWGAPVAALYALAGPADVFVKQSAFFSTAAVVTFGGAYAVLAFVAQQAVEVYHWLEPGEMLDGLGMAETTPGPLIQVVQFVGFMGAYRDPGTMNPYLAGALSSILVTWVTFVPCFLWIFLGAPYIESLRNNRALTAALSAITAAIVGVVLNLGVWFAIHTLFRDVGQYDRYALHVPLPRPASLDIYALAIGALAAFLLFRVKLGMLATLGICAAAGVAVFFVRRAL